MRFTCRAYAVCTGTRVLFANHKNVLKDVILIGWVPTELCHTSGSIWKNKLLDGLWKRAQCWVYGKRGRLEGLGRDEYNQNILYKIIKKVIKREKLAVFETRKYLCADLNPQTGIVSSNKLFITASSMIQYINECGAIGHYSFLTFLLPQVMPYTLPPSLDGNYFKKSFILASIFNYFYLLYSLNIKLSFIHSLILWKELGYDNKRSYPFSWGTFHPLKHIWTKKEANRNSWWERVEVQGLSTVYKVRLLVGIPWILRNK